MLRGTRRNQSGEQGAFICHSPDWRSVFLCTCGAALKLLGAATTMIVVLLPQGLAESCCTRPESSMDLSAQVQLVVWSVAIVGGLIGGAKALSEMHRSNEHRHEDRRWKQAEMAKKCLDELFGNALARSAMKMLDWDGLEYDVPGGGKTQQIEHGPRRVALRTTDTVFPVGDPAPFVRDCFDALFDGFERLEHFVRIGLILFEDVRQPLAYFVDKLAQPDEAVVMRSFLRTYGFRLAEAFLDRFETWKAAD